VYRENNVETSREIPSSLEVPVRNLAVELHANNRRVITLPFDVGAKSRADMIFSYVERLTDAEVDKTLEAVMRSFAAWHKRIEEQLDEHYAMAARTAHRREQPSRNRRLLIGAYFTREYSFESAALFNPSIVPHPQQDGLPAASLRFIMSMRAVGEGHVSSVIFRTGVIGTGHTVSFDRPAPYAARTRLVPDKDYHKDLFRMKLGEMGVNLLVADIVLNVLPDRFTLNDLALTIAQHSGKTHGLQSVASSMEWLARANYQLQLAPEDSISDLMLFPRSDSESKGIEDLRLVKFIDDDGTTSYFGTYTAFDGRHVLPMLLQTDDFRTVAVHTLNGSCVTNKGMALFPRRINGRYAICSRIDGRKLFLMYSDNVHFWHSARVLAEPKYPWEFRLMGNCGSPIETPAGWLLITHGVGPMRRYCLGAMLLDLGDPSTIIGRLKQPLIAPPEHQREGYVPNVVYSCGSLIHGDSLILPYAVADTSVRIAVVPLQELLAQLLRDGP